MNNLKVTSEENKNPAQKGMMVVLWIILGLAVLSVCVGLPVIYLTD